LPQVLPDGRSVLFTIAKVGDRPDDGQIALQSLTGGEPQILIERGADARYVSTGHLVYARDGTLLAVPFDLRRLQVTGAPTGVVGGVTQAVNTGSISLNDTGAAQFTLSASGAMAYLPGGIFPSIDRELVWVDRNGATTALPVPPRQYVGPRLSPDGQRFGVGTVGRDVHVWTYEFSRGVMTRLPFERTSIWTAWTPDSRRLTFYASDSPQGIVSMSPEGGEVERLTNTEGVPVGGQPGSWSPDGRTLAFVKNASTTNWDIWMFSRGRGEHKLRPVLPRPALERYVEFSPDGRWLAYASDESGRDEVYVERYPGSGERQQVSTDGGSEVAWAHSGRELFYAVTSGTVIKMFAVDVSLDPAFRASKPRVLFEGRYQPTTPLRSFDVTADGRHFLMTQNVEQSPAPLLTHIVVVLNWTEELRQRVPTR
jgi:serine/threonine-protein kinase